jgi:galactokinase
MEKHRRRLQKIRRELSNIYSNDAKAQRKKALDKKLSSRIKNLYIMSMIIKRSEITSEFFENHSILKSHAELLAYIRKIFKDEDELWFLKVPGRVNLIGEHVDYNNGPVLPCAIDREIVMCLAANASEFIRISNVNPEYQQIEFSIKKTIESYERGNWGNYIKAGVKGIIDHSVQLGEIEDQNFKGFDAVISSTLPPAAGLSSSSTLVVGAAMAFLTVNDIKMDTLKVAEICASGEHFVGTSGGGMDHAAILLGEKDSFSRIQFNPLAAESIAAPSDLEIILFHSLVEAEKSSHVREAYNRRVLECNFALDLFNKFLVERNLLPGDPLKFIGDISTDRFNLDQTELDLLIFEFFESLSETYLLEELLILFGISRDELANHYKFILRGSTLGEIPGGYNLKKRFKHVYTECQRVNQAVKCLKTNNKSELGRLLDASHESLSNDYEVSTPEVDSIVRLLKEFGAFGARLVGAGFGGMILALTDQSHAGKLIHNMKESFYSKQAPEGTTSKIIPCRISQGARILKTG